MGKGRSTKLVGFSAVVRGCWDLGGTSGAMGGSSNTRLANKTFLWILPCSLRTQYSGDVFLHFSQSTVGEGYPCWCPQCHHRPGAVQYQCCGAAMQPSIPICSPLLSHLVLGTDMGWLSRKGLETTPTACALCITHSVCSCFPNRDEGLSAWTKTSAPAVSGCSPRVFPAGQAPRPAPKILNHKAIQVPAYP